MADNELEPHIKEWLDTEAPATVKRFGHNTSLVRRHYAQLNVARSVGKCVAGINADLTLFVHEKSETKPIQICAKCRQGTCRDTCGAMEWIQSPGIKYEADDATYMGNDPSQSAIEIAVPPWTETHRDLEPGALYRVKGKIATRDFNGQAYLKIYPKSCTKVDEKDVQSAPAETPVAKPQAPQPAASAPTENLSADEFEKRVNKAVPDIKTAFRMFEGSMSKENWDAVTRTYADDVKSEVMKALQITIEQGKYVLPKAGV